MEGRTQRRIYLTLALLFGLPALVAGGGLAGMAVWTYFTRGNYMGTGEGFFLLCWSLAGLCGVLGWLWLSVVYVHGGRVALRRGSPWAWAGLALGVIAALGVLGLVLSSFLMAGSGVGVLGYLVFGPPLLVPTAHLLGLRRAQSVAVKG